MAQTHVSLGRANPAAATNGTLYTSPAVTKTMVTALFVCNTSSGDDSVFVYLVPSGGSANATNLIINQMVVDFGDPYLLNGVPILEAGDFIVVKSTNGNCTFTGAGLQIT